MKHSPCFLLALVPLLAAGCAAARTAPSWLDQAVPAAWNRPGESVPVAVRDDGMPMDERCLAQCRPPSASPADSAVTSAGWSLVGPLQMFGGTELVTAASAFDGMCRPLGYQAFVFVEGRYAGTLSPLPMDSRTDGVANTVRLLAADRLLAEFARYTDRDPLCCPSATTSIMFEVKGSGARTVVVPSPVRTQSTPPVPDRPLTGTYWKFTRLDIQEVTVAADQREPHLVLHADGRRVTGSGGCNALNGVYTIEWATLAFSPLATTKMMCPGGMDQEQRILEVLGRVSGWRIGGDRLELFDKDGSPLARLLAVDLK